MNERTVNKRVNQIPSSAAIDQSITQRGRCIHCNHSHHPFGWPNISERGKELTAHPQANQTRGATTPSQPIEWSYLQYVSSTTLVQLNATKTCGATPKPSSPPFGKKLNHVRKAVCFRRTLWRIKIAVPPTSSTRM